MNTEDKVNILLVDDNKDKIFAMASILDNPELNLIKCNSGEDGLRQLLNFDFAAILLDVNMPGMSGFDMARMIRERPRSRHTPIIFITAYSTTDIDVSKGYALGAVDYIFTPVVPAVLKAKVQAFVELFKKSEKIQHQNSELEQLRGHLEEMIAKRTAALEAEIIERKKAEKKIKESLEEKEILLAEIHHRVKNNMAVISGLLELEMAQLERQGLKKVLLSSKSRIKSMAMIHEKLYESMKFTHVKFGEYLKDLVRMVAASFSNDYTDIDLETKADDVVLNVNQAIPCALLLNELINNAFKHAFNGLNKGKIVIDFSDLGDMVEFRIEDDGVGLPDDLDLKNPKTLGMKLVQTLAKQLDAEFHLRNGQGTLIIVSFLKKEKRGSSSAHLLKK